jgi:hypothetical protein
MGILCSLAIFILRKSGGGVGVPSKKRDWVGSILSGIG